jgi:leucyl/phenylalanyl-tRNA---protein transferase
MSSLPWLNDNDFKFPDPDTALKEPNGLLAAGGSLAPENLLQAYSQGIFPWFEEDQPILWWSPDPRMVLYPEELHISKSLAKAMKKSSLRISSDEAFREVITACAGERPYSDDTWITETMIDAYCTLHTMGVAHSIEAWDGDKLVGGLYGLAIGEVFFGESMFSYQDNASKIAFATLIEKLGSLNYKLIDCQVSSAFLSSFGAREISRVDFMTQLPKNMEYGRNKTHWPLQLNS